MALVRLRLLVCALAGVGLLAFAGEAGAAVSGCAAQVLKDWRTGRISLRYAPSCYRTALANLPEDMLVYSSAQDDIQRALQARLTQLASVNARGRVLAAHHASSAGKQSGSKKAAAQRAALASIETSAAHDGLPVPVLVAGAAGLLLVAIAAASRLARKLRR